MEDFITTFVTDTHVVYTNITTYIDSLDLFLQWERDEAQAELDLDLELQEMLEDLR